MPTVKPSKRLLKIVEAYPSTTAAGRALGLEWSSMDRFLKGRGGLTADALASIMEATKLRFEDLFVVEAERGETA